jgi:hypothetical protein
MAKRSCARISTRREIVLGIWSAHIWEDLGATNIQGAKVVHDVFVPCQRYYVRLHRTPVVLRVCK